MKCFLTVLMLICCLANMAIPLHAQTTYSNSISLQRRIEDLKSKCLSEDPKIAISAIQEYSELLIIDKDKFLYSLLASPLPDVRKAVIYNLSVSGYPDVLEQLRKMNNDKDDSVRFEAAIALAQRHEPRIARVLRECFVKVKPKDIYPYLGALLDSDDSIGVDFVYKYIEESKDYSMLENLLEHINPKYADVYFQAMSSENEEIIQAGAAGLAILKDPRYLQYARAQKPASDEELVSNLINFGNEGIKIISELAESKDDYTRVSLSSKLIFENNSQLFPIIVKLTTDKNENVVRNSIEALRNHNTEESVNLLYKFAADSKSDYRRQAMESLGKIGSQSAIDKLAALIDDSDNSVRLKVISTLALKKDKRALPFLNKMLLSKDEDSCLLALTRYDNFLDDVDQNILLKLLKDTRNDVNNYSMKLLMNIPNPNNVKIIVDFIKSKDAKFRSSLLYNLSIDLKANKQMLNAWHEALSYTRNDIHTAILIMLANNGDMRVSKNLSDYIDIPSYLTYKGEKNSSYYQRENAFRVLVQLDPLSVREHLLDIISKEYSDITDIAISGLANIGNDKDIEYLMNVLRGDAYDLRNYFADDLRKFDNKPLVQRFIKEAIVSKDYPSITGFQESIIAFGIPGAEDVLIESLYSYSPPDSLFDFYYEQKCKAGRSRKKFAPYIPRRL